MSSCSSTKITSMSCTSAFTGTWYSARLAFMKRPNRWSISVSSCSAMPMPQTTPPMIWLRAVLGLRMRPAAIALTMRVTRTMPRSSSTFTSAKTAECVLLRMRGVLFGLGGLLLLDAVHAALPHGIGDRHRARRVAPAHDPAVREHDLVGRRLGERRLRHLLGQAQQLSRIAPAVVAIAVRHRGRDPRSAFDRRLRQRRIAELDGDVLERQARASRPRSAP